MLIYKAWLETRSRFYAGMAMMIGLSAFMVVANPWIISQWRLEELLEPKRVFAAWSYRAETDYVFFVWHFLYGYLLQQLFVLFAMLLGMGGIVREKAQGVAGFTLSLPMRRERLFGVRVLVGAMQIAALAVAGTLAIVALSPVIGKPYPLGQALGHTLLLICGGLLSYCVGLLLSTVVNGEHAPTLLGISSVAFLYFTLQPYVDGPEPPLFLRMIDVPRVVAGPPNISGLMAIHWSGVMAILSLAAALLAISMKITKWRDF